MSVLEHFLFLLNHWKYSIFLFLRASCSENRFTLFGLRSRSLGGDSNSQKAEAHADLIMAWPVNTATASCSNCVMLCLRKVSSLASQRYTVSLSGTTAHAQKLAMR